MCVLRAEDARVQEDATGAHLPYLQHYATQFPVVECHVTHLLLRVRGAALGDRAPGRPLLGMRRQVSRKVQRPPQRGLLAE
jgi:hypothetical protein